MGNAVPLSEFFDSKTFQEYVMTHDVSYSDRMLSYFASQLQDKECGKSLIREIAAHTNDQALQSEISEYFTMDDPDEAEDDKFWNAFEHGHPYPFQRGDIIRIIDDPDVIGVVDSTEEEWSRYANPEGRMADFTDTVVPVTFVSKSTGEVYRDHPPILSMEKVQLDNNDQYAQVVYAVSQFVIGNMPIETVRGCAQAYQDTIEHIDKE
jgi:hypothetical protein